MTEPARRVAGDRERDKVAGEGVAAVEEWAVAQARAVVAVGWAVSQPGPAAAVSAQAAVGPRAINKACLAPASSVLRVARR